MGARLSSSAALQQHSLVSTFETSFALPTVEPPTCVRAVIQFAALMKTIQLGTEGVRRDGADGLADPELSSEATNRTERALLRQMPKRSRKPFKMLRENMLHAGFSVAEMHAVCRAMFVTQTRESLLPAWRVFDPMGRDSLSLREVRVAHANPAPPERKCLLLARRAAGLC